MDASHDVAREPGFDWVGTQLHGSALLENGLLDEEALPDPVSSFEHVARSTGGRESLVPPKPLWPFGLRHHPHRKAS
jgi:hypothetical protein